MEKFLFLHSCRLSLARASRQTPVTIRLLLRTMASGHLIFWKVHFREHSATLMYHHHQLKAGGALPALYLISLPPSLLQLASWSPPFTKQEGEPEGRALVGSSQHQELVLLRSLFLSCSEGAFLALRFCSKELRRVFVAHVWRRSMSCVVGAL